MITAPIAAEPYFVKGPISRRYPMPNDSMLKRSAAGGGGVGTASSLGVLFTYSIRPNKVFVPSRSALVSSKTLLLSRESSELRFAP